MVNIFLTLLLAFSVNAVAPVETTEPLATRQFSLENRYGNEFVNNVFRDNILLVLKKASGEMLKREDIDWNAIASPSTYGFTLNPGETFSFHDDVLPEYEGKITTTTNSHFNAQEGFRSSGSLYGDGVCHLASLIYWAAKDAGLTALSPVAHDFATIPEVPREYGVSIYATPGKQIKDQRENLYITNNRENPITFDFSYDGTNLTVAVLEKKRDQRVASLISAPFGTSNQ